VWIKTEFGLKNKLAAKTDIGPGAFWTEKAPENLIGECNHNTESS